jgi:hypothetical protein
MLKKIATFFLTLLFLPVAVVCSAIFLASYLLVFPLAVLGGAIRVATPIASWLLDKIFDNDPMDRPPFYLMFMTSAVLKFTLTTLTLIPLAAVIAVVSTVLAPFFLPLLTAAISYSISKFTINRVGWFKEEYVATKEIKPSLTNTQENATPVERPDVDFRTTPEYRAALKDYLSKPPTKSPGFFSRVFPPDERQSTLDVSEYRPASLGSSTK